MSDSRLGFAVVPSVSRGAPDGRVSGAVGVVGAEPIGGRPGLAVVADGQARRPAPGQGAQG